MFIVPAPIRAVTLLQDVGASHLQLSLHSSNKENNFCNLKNTVFLEKMNTQILHQQ